VTGATGMLGGYVIERFRAEGWRVRGLVRDAARVCRVEALGAQAFVGDVTSADAVRAAAGGCHAIVHAAAAIGPGRDWETFRTGNVKATENVVAAAADAGARLVHVSSTAVFGQDRYSASPTDETAPLPRLPAWDAYGRSKQEAERRVLAAHAAGLWATVVRPPVMYGRRDRQFVPRLAPVLARGFFPLVAGGRNTLSLVHAHAVADGVVRAVLADRAQGRVYHLTNDFEVTVADLVRYAAAGLRRRIRTPHVPAAAARAALQALAVVLVATGRGDLAPHAAGVFAMLTRDNPFTSERARRELGWSPRIHPADGLPEAFRWWHDQGHGRVSPRASGPAPASRSCARDS
jgi:nucleoside-diphosphate-sugar epimerase